MTLSVVIPLYNQAHSTHLALWSLARQQLDTEQFEVVLVDDCSTEDLRPIVDQYADRMDLRYLRNPTNLGRARARNRGVEAARHEDLVLLDGDTFCAPDLLLRHQKFTGRADGDVLLGRRLESGWATLAALSRGEVPMDTSPAEEDQRDGRMMSPAMFAESRTPWMFVFCHNMSLSRTLFDAVGGFDTSFDVWGYEDTDIAYRIFRHHGRESGHFVYDPDAVGYHLPHYRNWAADWAGAQKYLPYMRSRYGHYDVELLGGPPVQASRAITEYESSLDRMRASAARTPAAAAADRVAPLGRELWLGFDLDRTGPRCDHARPIDRDNLHLLGITLPYPNRRFDRVVNLDIWRILSVMDLSSVINEGLRVASEVLLVASLAYRDPPAVSDLTYVQGMLGSHFEVSVTHTDDDIWILRCRRRRP